MMFSVDNQGKLAIELAEELYKKNGLPKEMLFTDILQYAKHHYAYFSPTCLIMARLIEEKDADGFPQTGWFIEVAVGLGTLKRFFDLAPCKANFIGFARKGKESKWYDWDRFKRLVTHER